MQDWLVGGALIQGPEGVLLVKNRRRNGAHDWSPPGGVIDKGETLLDGLAREVVEETGLIVSEWEGPVYEITAVAPGLGWTLRVEAYRALGVGGELELDDPDGIVVDARYVGVEQCESHLDGSHPWVAEPLLEWLAVPWQGLRSFKYRVEGVKTADLVITRL